jgi:hypothetical protein
MFALARRLDAATPPDLRVLAWATTSTILLGAGDGSHGGVMIEDSFYEEAGETPVARWADAPQKPVVGCF